MEKCIRIYSDDGVSKFSLNCLLKSLESMSLKTQLISSKEVIETSWEEKTSVFIMPGGRDFPYVKKLTGIGNQKIRSFVEDGGSYLGICAGAYYGSNAVEFEKGNDLEVLGNRELKFTTSKAIGPAYKEPKFCYNSHKGARAALVSYRSDRISDKSYMYFNGGCYFEEASLEDTIGEYLDLDQGAIVRRNVKNGRVILSGVHFECSVDDFDHINAQNLSMIEAMKKTEDVRKKIFEDILKMLI